jgi:hypothetical protein
MLCYLTYKNQTKCIHADMQMKQIIELTYLFHKNIIFISLQIPADMILWSTLKNLKY